jgi:uncharacterized membrane protein
MAELENQKTVTPKQEPADQQPLNVGGVEISANQAKKTAEQMAGQVAGQLKGGMEQLKKVDVTKMFQSAAGQPAVTKYERLLGGISYIPLAPIGTLVLKGDSNYVKLHGRQSLVITGIFFLCLFIYIVPYIGVFLAGLIQFGMFVLGVFSMYQALIGNWWKIPLLGDISEAIPISFFIQAAKEVVTGQPQKAEESAVKTEEVKEVVKTEEVANPTPEKPVQEQPPQTPPSATV